MPERSLNTFGRLVAPKDGRDFRYLMKAATAQVRAVVTPKRRVLPYRDGPLLDQGRLPHCVAFAGRGFLDSAPLMSRPDAPPTTQTLYAMCQDRDEWPGTDYDGTSVRALMKALVDVGDISSYAWGQSVDEAKAWLLGGYGTLIVGTNWYREMSDVDREGFMGQPAASLVTPIGGHAWRLTWYDVTRGCFVMKNSWGASYGWPVKGSEHLSGYARVAPKLLQRLLEEDGEITAPTQVRLRPVKV